MRTGRVTVTSTTASLTLPIRRPADPDGEVTQVGVQLATSEDNDAIVYVSQDSDITAGSADSTDGYPIAAGVASFFLPVTTFGQTVTLYFRAPTGTQYVWWMLV